MLTLQISNVVKIVFTKAKVLLNLIQMNEDSTTDLNQSYQVC